MLGIVLLELKTAHLYQNGEIKLSKTDSRYAVSSSFIISVQPPTNLMLTGKLYTLRIYYCIRDHEKCAVGKKEVHKKSNSRLIFSLL